MIYSSSASLDFDTAFIIAVNGTAKELLLTGLTPDTLYTLRVEGYTTTNRVLIIGEIQAATIPGLLTNRAI